MQDEYLRTYLNDHLAGAKAGLQLAKDCQAHNEGTDLAASLSQVIPDIEDDHQVLKEIYSRVHSRENPIKKSLTWLLAKAGRFKLEGTLLRYSDLSRLEELEGLMLGIRGKLALWSALEASLASDARFDDIDFARLQQRAQHQRDTVEEHRIAAAQKVFS